MLSNKGAACAICAHTQGMSNKHVKKYSRSLAFMKIQSKFIAIHYNGSIIMVKTCQQMS